MSKLLKAILIIYAIIVIIATAFFYSAIAGVWAMGAKFLVVEKYLKSFVSIDNNYGMYILAGIAGIVCLGALILLIVTIARPSRSSSLTLVNNNGSVELTDDAIEAYVYRSLNRFPQIRHPEVHVRIKNGSTKQVITKVVGSVGNTQDVTSMAETLSTQIRNDISTFIGQDIATVNVKLDKPTDGNTKSINDSQAVVSDDAMAIQ